MARFCYRHCQSLNSAIKAPVGRSGASMRHWQVVARSHLAVSVKIPRQKILLGDSGVARKRLQPRRDVPASAHPFPPVGPLDAPMDTSADVDGYSKRCRVGLRQPLALADIPENCWSLPADSQSQKIRFENYAGSIFFGFGSFFDPNPTLIYISSSVSSP